MACQIQTDKYTDVVLDLIKLDSTVYNSFDNAASFILKSGLLPEQKMMALHNMAHIYSGMAGLDPKYFTPGKATDVMNILSTTENPTDYVQAANKLYNLKTPTSLNFNTILSKIDALGGKVNINRLDLNGPDGILSVVKNYFAVAKFESLEDRTKMLEEISAQIRTIIIDRSENQDHKDFLIRQVEETVNSLQRNSSFISIAEISDIANLDNVLVILKSGNMIEAIRQDNKLYATQPDGSLQEIPAVQIESAKESRLSDRSPSNAGEHVFYEDTMFSNFRVVPVNPQESETVLKKLDSMPFPTSGIRISAVRISDVGDRRVERIQALAENNPEMASLANRKHETFENSTQVAYLRSTSNGEVLTLSRPKASEQMFVLVGEIIGSGEKFYLYSSDNLAFVSSDNSTERVDFSNPAHLKKVQALSAKSNMGKKNKLSDGDVELMADAAVRHDAFKATLAPIVQAQFDEGATSVDITQEFNNIYEIGQSRSEKTKTSLSKEIETDPTLSITLTVINTTTKVTEERKIPFMYNVVQNGDVKDYMLVDMLRTNEKILFTGEDGTVSEITQEAYARQELKLEDKTVRNLLKGSDPKQKNMVIMFRPDGSMTYRIAENVRQLDQMEEFATFIVGLADTLESNPIPKDAAKRDEAVRKRDSAMFEYDKTGFTFKFATANRKNPDRPLFVSFSTNRAGNLQVKLTPRNKNASGRYSFMTPKDELTGKTRNLDQFRFVIDEDIILKTAKALKAEGTLINKIKEAYPALAKYDLNNSQELFEFYRILNNMSRGATPDPLLLELSQQIKKANARIAQMLIDKVVNRFEEKTKMFPEFMKNLREDFTYNGEFKPEYLVANRVNGELMVNVVYSPDYKPKDGVNAKERFRVNYDNYKIVSSGAKRLTIVPKAAMALTKPAAAPVTVVPNAEPVAKIHVQTPAPPTITDNTDIPEINLFSIVGSDIETETPQERLQASEWFSQTLPQFGISPTDVADLVDLAKIDGTVLGLFKDLMIHLNNNLLGKGVVYHEAFHGVFRHLMTDAYREQLIQEVKKSKKHAAKFTEAALKEFARERNYVYSKERMENLQAEEIMADGFQDYMNKKGAPAKTLLGTFMEMLKRLIDLFTKNANIIDNEYGRIRRGYYKTAVLNSGLVDNQAAFALIPGLKKISKSLTDVGVAQRQSPISVSDQNQLIYMMAHYFVADNTAGETFEQKFDRLAQIVLDKEYNLDRIIASSKKPEMRDEIIKRYGDIYKQYRFMLGARMNGEILYDLNASGNPAYDEKVLENSVKEANDNNNGEMSKKVLMEIVKKEYLRIEAILDGKEQEETTLSDVAEQALNEDGTPVQNPDDEDGTNDQETESQDFDKNIYEHNRLESLNKEIRRFLAQVKYEVDVPELGIKVPKLINGDKIFSLLLKITADIDTDNIIEHIRITAENQRLDGNIDTANDLKAVYENLLERTKMDSNGVPQANQQLYYMLIDVLEGTEIDYLMTNIRTRQEQIDKNEYETTTFGYSIMDKVLSEDVNKRKKDIVASIISTHAEKANSTDDKEAKKYKEDAKTLRSLSKLIAKSTPGSYILSDPRGQGVRLNELTEELHTAMKNVGINIPKSLIRMSILGIDKTDNEVIHKEEDFETSVTKHYNAHSKFIGEKKYLEKGFFEDMIVIFEKAVEDTHDDFANLLDDSNMADDNIKRFNAILGKAATYMIKYDPTELQSSVRNAEGKPIYRYVKYTPALTIAQSLRSKGLLETYQSDPYFATQMENFLRDNPMLGGILKGDKSDRTKQIELMLNNFRVALYGGVKQSINNVSKGGVSFKNIDDRSMYILNLHAFMNRTTYRQIVKDETGANKLIEVETFMRSFSQLEASQTNFLMTGMYESFADKKGMVKDSAGRLKIVSVMEGVIAQEYNRIAREYSQRVTRKAQFDSGASNNLILKYNAIHSKEDVTKADVENKNLRAYKFNKLDDFFETYPELYKNSEENGLFDFAKKNQSFETLPAELKKELLDSLNNYAQEQLDKHMNKLETLKVIQKQVQPRRVAKQNNVPAGQRDRSGEVIVQAGTNIPSAPIVFYTSSLIAPSIKKDSTVTVNAFDIYKPSDITNDERGNPAAPKEDLQGLIADAYFNFWANSLQFNDLMDGDVAMNVKDSVDYFKRHKKFLAAGSTMKKGTHKVAYINTIKGFVHDAFPTHGPYYSKAEIERDPDLPEDLRERFLQDYNKAINNVEEVDEAGNVIKYENMLQKTFDGQSISTLMHQIDMHEAMGRLSPEIFKLLIEKHYRKLTADEVKLMQNGKVVNNPKKTVTASTNSYHKLSENLIDRNDASILFIPDGVREQGGDAIKAYIKETHDKMLGFYLEIHKLRKQIQDLKEVGIDSSDLYKEIQDITFQIHSYYRPMLGREVLHNLLNSMEFYQIDQLMDTEASKNATILPVDYFAEAARPDRKYINLGLSSLEVQNKFKYLQVETSGIKDVAKISNQSKGLIAADIINLMEIAEASGRPITETDRIAISNVANVLVDYQKTLRGLAESNLTNLRTMLRKGGDFEIGKVFNLIRESLESQGAPTSTLKLFDVNADGKPVHSPNLPGIRNTLEFYFFSQYSKHITDEKGSGFKNIHISSLGYDIIVDQDNKVILTSDYRRNPAKYPGARSRKLGVETVVNKDGTTTYFVECIMPEPYFRDNAHKKFYMEKLNKMFAARIPTEDKRSMIALKVVDFMDSSNLNGVIVPHFIHMLSGSDFDVDALYGQTYAHYFNADGTPSLYGDYSAYASENEGKYVEFVEYMANDKDIKVAVKAENDRLDAISDEDFNVYDSVKTFVSYISPRLQNDIPTLRKYEAILKVFEKYGLPVSLEAFNATPAYSQSVRPIYQNKNLAAKLDIISNQAVFKFLYINERSSTERAEQSLDEFGIPLESKAGKFNKYTIDGVIAVKKTNSMNKDGISITANISKFLSLASQYGLELKPSEVIWAFQKATALDKDGNFKLISESYSKFGTLNTEGKRVMEIIGNILGMFADGAKKPIPSALYMNEENAGVTLAMIGVGLSPDFALGFNFIPEIRNAISEVMASKNAISEQTGNSLMFLSSEVKNELRDLIYKNQTEFDQLKELGVISSGSTATFVTVQNKNIVLEFTSPKQNKTKLDLNKLDNNTLTTKEIGYNMSAVIKAGTKNAAGEESTENVIIALTETQQKMILLQMYAAQSQQTFALRRAGSVPNLFKALTPQFTNFDRLVANIADLKENTERNIFTEESTNRMFADNQVWAVLYESMLDLNDQASKLFLERTPFFAPIKKAFEDVFTNHSQIAKIITSFVALKKYQMSMPGSRSSKIEAMNELIAQDDKNLVQTFTAEYWFTNTLAEELEEMQKKYPENKFLQLLRAEKTENTAYTASGKPVSEKMLKMINKSKLSGKAAEEVVDDASFLMYEENMFVKKLFYHELAKTGMQQKSGSFLQFLPADLLVPISEYINDFVTKLENTKGNRYELVNAIKDFMGPEYTQEDVYALFNELFIQMAHAAKTEAGNTKIKGVKAFQFKDTSTLMKSFKFDKENATQKRAVAIETVKHFIGQGPAGDSTSYTPKSINPDTKKADEVITINMNVPGPAISQATKATMLELGKAVGIKGAFGNPDNYTFPLMFSMDANTYLLQGVDNEIDNKNFGESMIKSIVGTGQYKTTGKIARYTLIPKELSAGTLSPIGFTKEASQEYMDLINKKARLSVEPVVSEVKPVQSVQGKRENPLVEIGVKPTDMSGNAAKDIQMADEATQFIGFQSGNATISSTSTYRLAWGNNANTGQYKASDVIMVSGSGLWRGVTQEQIKETLSTRYKPLLDKAIEAGASFVVGNQYSKGNLSDQLISEYLKKRGYTEQKLNGYSRYSLTAQSQVKTTPATQPSTSVKAENITSKGSEFAKKLTNVGNTVGLTYKGKEYVNSEHAYQTWKSGEFNQAGYDLKGGKVRGGKIGDTFSIMTDILTEKLKQHPELVKGINERGGLAYIEQSTHNVIGDKFWESTGENKFIKALAEAYQNISTIQPSTTAEIFEDAPAKVEQSEVAEPQFGSDGSMDMSSMLREARKEREAKANAEAASTTTKLSTPQKPIHIYSDGSDIKGTGKIGFGAVFEYGGIMYDLSGTEESPEVKRLAEIHPDAKFSNPTMEMMALVSVLNTFKNKAEHIVINQDYTGAVNYDGLWQKAEGSAQRQPKPWKAKEAYIKTLVNAGVKIIEQIESNGGSVQINWVKGHSGNRMNDLADTAAKSREIFNNMTKAYENADKTQVDMKNLNLTPQVIDALYEQGRKSLSKQEFAKAAADMVAKLRSTMTPNQILEKINCL